jgi:uncharacterized protein YllA (UPF0747 family)
MTPCPVRKIDHKIEAIMTPKESAIEDALSKGSEEARERYFEGEPEAQQEELVIENRPSKYKRGRRWWDDRS